MSRLSYFYFLDDSKAFDFIDHDYEMQLLLKQIHEEVMVNLLVIGTFDCQTFISLESVHTKHHDLPPSVFS